MQKDNPSIFNDVLGPVMCGPSSSHTAASGRIGLLVRYLVDDVCKATIRFPATSSYASTYKGQRSDIAFIAGILGINIDDPDFVNSMEIARRKGLDFSFSIEDIPSFHPNTVITTLTDRSGYEVTARGLSTGGGMFEIDEIDGEQVNISGEWHEILCISGQRECKVFEKLEKTFIRHQQPLHISVPPAPDGMLVNFKLSDPPDENVLDEIREIMDSEQGRVIYIPPILPVANGKNTEELFDTEKKLQAFLKDHPMELWEAAVEYEVRRSGWSKEQVMKYAINLIRVMSESITRGLEGNFNPSGFLEPSAGSIARAASENRLIPTGVIQDASIFSVAVMEYNAVMGKVVAGPTAGSCGVLPAVLFSLQRLYGYSQLELAKALMCAGLIGAFIASHATFSAEVCACQAENGSASSMAAAAVSHLVSSDLQVAIKSASLALQNMLGSICDPVAGGIEIPCISRNVLAATNALVSVNMVMGGFDPVIPLDQVIVAMREVGKLLPPELRCTCRGGLCVTQKAQELDKMMKKKYATTVYHKSKLE